MPKHDTIYSIHLVKPTNKKLSMHDPSYEQAGIPFTEKLRLCVKFGRYLRCESSLSFHSNTKLHRNRHLTKT